MSKLLSKSAKLQLGFVWRSRFKDSTCFVTNEDYIVGSSAAASNSRLGSSTMQSSSTHKVLANQRVTDRRMSEQADRAWHTFTLTQHPYFTLQLPAAPLCGEYENEH